MGNDKRLDDLNAELVVMVETANEEIAKAKQYAAQLEMMWVEKINQQRGRILERETIVQENAGNTPQSHENAPLSVLPAQRGAITDERQKEA